MKILALAYVDMEHPYGSHTRPFYICRYLSRMGHEVIVACVRGVNEPLGPQFLELRSMRLGSPFRFFPMLGELGTVIRKVKPDIIYSHDSMLTILSYLWRKTVSTRALAVLDKHGSWAMEQSNSLLHPLLTSVESLAIRCTDRIVAASDELRFFLLQKYSISQDKISVMPNGVDNSLFYPLPKKLRKLLRSRTRIERKKVIIFPAPRVFSSNILAIKFMHKVMKMLYEKDPSIILLITGGGPIIEAQLPNVIYTGIVRNLNDCINMADVAVAPYRREAVCGGARNKVLEYFACKVPVVSTREGIRGIPEASHGERCIISSDDPLDFAEKILLTLSLSDRRRGLYVDKAYALVSRKYNWERLAAYFGGYLRSLIDVE